MEGLTLRRNKTKTLKYRLIILINLETLLRDHTVV